jgi:hypothetical protein
MLPLALLTKKGQQFGISQFELFCFSSNCNGHPKIDKEQKQKYQRLVKYAI